MTVVKGGLMSSVNRMDLIADLVASRPGIRPSELADAMNVSRARVSNLIPEMLDADRLWKKECKGRGYRLFPPSNSKALITQNWRKFYGRRNRRLKKAGGKPKNIKG